MDRVKINNNNNESRLYLYGGCFDLVNGLSLPNSAIEDIKFSALFYKHIVVPDGFFHCYGPLYTHFSNIKKQCNKQDVISEFLKGGIIVPSLRTGDSLFNNWMHGGNIGINPGQFMIINEDDGKEVIRNIDDLVSKYMHWPSDMGSANKIEFSKLIYDVLVDGKSEYSLLHKKKPKNLPYDQHFQWMESERLLEEFIGEITDNRENPKFRRGNIEGLIGRNIGLDMKSYHELKHRGLTATPWNDLKFAYAYYLANISTTVYEAYHANQFNTAGGLFPAHEDNLIAHGLYDYLVDLKDLNGDNNEKRVLFGTLDTSKLSPNEIVKFREEDIFLEYCEFVKRIDNTYKNSFAEANQEFISFLIDKYIPAIIKRYPHSGYIEKTIKVAGDVATIVAFLCDNNLANIKVGGVTLATYVGATLMADRFLTDRFTPIIRDIERFIKTKYLTMKFKLGNYQAWRGQKKA